MTDVTLKKAIPILLIIFAVSIGCYALSDRREHRVDMTSLALYDGRLVGMRSYGDRLLAGLPARPVSNSGDDDE